MNDYQRHHTLERRLRRTVEEHGAALAALAALDRARARRGPVEEASPPRPRAAATPAPARLDRRPAHAMPSAAVPTPTPAAPASPIPAVPLTIGATGRWRCGHAMTLGIREANAASSRGLPQVPCPLCGTPGLVGQLQGDVLVPIRL